MLKFEKFEAVLEEYESLGPVELARLAGCRTPEPDSAGARLLDVIHTETMAAAGLCMEKGWSPRAVIHTGRATKIATDVLSAGWTDLARPSGLAKLSDELEARRREYPNDAQGVRSLAALQDLADTLVRALIKGLDDRYEAIVAEELAEMYAEEFEALRELGYSPIIYLASGVYSIRIALGDIGGEPAYMLMSNSFGLATTPEEADCWSTSVYTIQPESHIPIEADGWTALGACTATLEAIRASTRVAVRTEQTGDDWVSVWCPTAALGDPKAEHEAIRPQVFRGYHPGVIVIDPAPGFPAGCSTHSHVDRDEREQARAGHWDCEHERFAAPANRAA